MCKEGKIIGARKQGRDWIIPENAQKPIDRRTKTGKDCINNGFYLPMPKKTPFLDMSNLYNTPGKAEECAEKLKDNPEAINYFVS